MNIQFERCAELRCGASSYLKYAHALLSLGEARSHSWANQQYDLMKSGKRSPLVHSKTQCADVSSETGAQEAPSADDDDDDGDGDSDPDRRRKPNRSHSRKTQQHHLNKAVSTILCGGAK